MKPCPFFADKADNCPKSDDQLSKKSPVVDEEEIRQKIVAEFPSACIEVVGHSILESRLHQDGILISQTSKEVSLQSGFICLAVCGSLYDFRSK